MSTSFKVRISGKEESIFITVNLLKKGVSIEQDTRFTDKMNKLKETMPFPSKFKHSVDMKKVDFDTIKPWIATKVTKLLGYEDEIIIGLVFNLFEVEVSKYTTCE